MFSIELLSTILADKRAPQTVAGANVLVLDFNVDLFADAQLALETLLKLVDKDTAALVAHQVISARNDNEYKDVHAVLLYLFKFLSKAYNSNIAVLALLSAYILKEKAIIIETNDAVEVFINTDTVTYSFNLLHNLIHDKSQLAIAYNYTNQIAGMVTPASTLFLFSGVAMLAAGTNIIDVDLFKTTLNDVIMHKYKNSPVASPVLNNLMRMSKSEILTAVSELVVNIEHDTDSVKVLLDVINAIAVTNFRVYNKILSTVLKVDNVPIITINVTQYYKRGTFDLNSEQIAYAMYAFITDVLHIDVFPIPDPSKVKYATVSDIVSAVDPVHTTEKYRAAVVELLVDKKLLMSVLEYAIVKNTNYNYITEETLRNDFSILNILDKTEFNLLFTAIDKLYIVQFIKQLLKFGLYNVKIDDGIISAVQPLVGAFISYGISKSVFSAANYPVTRKVIEFILMYFIDLSIDKISTAYDKVTTATYKQLLDKLINQHAKDLVLVTVNDVAYSKYESTDKVLALDNTNYTKLTINTYEYYLRNNELVKYALIQTNSLLYVLAFTAAGLQIIIFKRTNVRSQSVAPIKIKKSNEEKLL